MFHHRLNKYPSRSTRCRGDSSLQSSQYKVTEVPVLLLSEENTQVAYEHVSFAILGLVLVFITIDR